jgi:hypothetical protein
MRFKPIISFKGGGYAIVFNYVARFYKKKYRSSKDATKNEESDTAVFNKVAW